MSPRRKPEIPSGKVRPSNIYKSVHAENHVHHPDSVPAVHAPHHPQKKEVLPPRHTPHTGPELKELDIDHGTHDDRPRPGKIAKKADHGRSKK